MKLGEVSRVAGTLKNNKHVSDIFINKQTPNQWTNWTELLSERLRRCEWMNNNQPAQQNEGK